MTKPYRLPSHVRPSRYDIHLDARVQEPTFRGSVRIELDLARPTRRIELHGRDLAVRAARLHAGGGATPANAEH
ncbi:MAG TPA: hypothetical protein VM582_09600, partial [Candidatus Thermoplasmatota archaeon]|nr:hypothetical protein [Candidatus Thermoplasmatota archaeon]